MPLKSVLVVSLRFCSLNANSSADGAQMDSKGGISLKIHCTQYYEAEQRGVGIKH